MRWTGSWVVVLVCFCRELIRNSGSGSLRLILDRSGLHWRVLNRRKGPAVHGPRAQIHREWYKTAVKEHLATHPSLQILEGSVKNILVENDKQVAGLVLEDGSRIGASAVVLATGTFLGGQIHLGKSIRPAGRIGEASSHGLSEYLRDVGFRIARLKTGTPPRLSRRTIDFSKCIPQPGDDIPSTFSYIPPVEPARNLIQCYQTFTNPEAHKVVHKYAHENVHIDTTATGPRYCPSIESKVFRFPDRVRHIIWLEPETIEGDLVYPNGISMTMPRQGQVEFLRHVRGLESVEVLQPGYGVEYDFVDPIQLRSSLETRRLCGLFLAGQINGTTGYEEAATQGLVAGANAALKTLEREPFIITRADGLSGILIDDLVTKGVSEPYRMFTARSEFRMLHRSDNADERLTLKGCEAGIVRPTRQRHFESMHRNKEKLKNTLGEFKRSPLAWNSMENLSVRFSENGQPRSALKLLESSDVSLDDLERLVPEIASFPQVTKDRVKVEATYAPYLHAAMRDMQQVLRDEALKIPEGIDYTSIVGLSLEQRDRLQQVQPSTLGQAQRIEGMTPAASVALLKFVRRPHHYMPEPEAPVPLEMAAAA